MKQHRGQILLLSIAVVSLTATVARAQDVCFVYSAPLCDIGVQPLPQPGTLSGAHYGPNWSACDAGPLWTTWFPTTYLPVSTSTYPVLSEVRADRIATHVVNVVRADAPSQSRSHAFVEDATLRTQMAAAGIQPLEAQPAASPHLVELGRMLFHDRILSGNRDTSCATCHHEDLAMGDALSHSIGTGGIGLGPKRRRGEDRRFTRRNSPGIFNRGLPQWRTQFWDTRVQRIPEGVLNPAEVKLPYAFSHVLEVQAMFPVAARDEMRGDKGDVDVFGNPNELALIDDDDQPAIWRALMQRILGPDGGRNPNAPGYRRLFVDAYPQKPLDQLGFEHAAIALATFERTAFTLLDSPWDRFVAGDGRALTPAAKRGASLFFGKARCVSCHRGSLLTDQEHYNILVPHVGSKHLTSSDEDRGRFDKTKDLQDNCAFRTPPLRNVAVTGPWMHNGAYITLDAAVRHHLDPVAAFLDYDPRQLQRGELRAVVRNSRQQLNQLLPTLAPQLAKPTNLAEAEIADLLQFLHALTSPSLGKLAKHVPAHVPSGLPVDGRERQPTGIPANAVGVHTSGDY